MKSFLTTCTTCGRTTSKAYAKGHDGQCKQCAEPPQQDIENVPFTTRMIDCGYEAHAREEGYYD